MIYTRVASSPMPDAWELSVLATNSNDVFNIDVQGDDTTNLTINWGDGTVENYTTVGTKSHTYTTAGSYTASISGSMTPPTTVVPSIEVGSNGTTVLITATSAIPAITNLENVKFNGIACSFTTVPSDLFSYNPQLTSFANTFENCTSLTSIPNNLFDNNTAVTSFVNTFVGCTSLTSIPSNLFDNNTAVTSFSETFVNCSSLTSIPSNLFDYNTAVTNFSATFSGCTGITSVLTGLFNNNTAVTSFEDTFFAVPLTTASYSQLHRKECIFKTSYCCIIIE